MDTSSKGNGREAGQALIVWGIFMVLLILLNGTVLFVFGVDMREWTGSRVKGLLFDSVIYGGLFLAVPMILVKGWRTVRKPGFTIALLAAVAGISLRSFIPYSPAIVPPLIVFLHWRYDLSGLGIRSIGWKGDLAAVGVMAVLGLGAAMIPFHPLSFSPVKGLLTAAERMFANPASTAENLFYFGFLAERLSRKTGPWLTPLVIGSMYTLHEMTNPEYWYAGMSFPFVFVGLIIVSAIYMWRRSLPIVWLGDGIFRFMQGSLR